MVETGINNKLPKIQTLLQNKGIGFKSLSFRDIEGLLLDTGIPCIDETKAMRLSINSNNHIYFMTNDEALCSLWFNESVGYKLKIIIKDTGKEDLSEEEIKTLKEIYELRDFNVLSLTEDLIIFLKERCDKKNTPQPEEPPKIPGTIARTVKKIKRRLKGALGL